MSAWKWIGVGTMATSALVAAACSLNPQPLPPETGDNGVGGDGGATPTQGEDGGGGGLHGDAGFNDSGLPPPGDSGTSAPDAGSDAMDGSDAPTDAYDGGLLDAAPDGATDANALND